MHVSKLCYLFCSSIFIYSKFWFILCVFSRDWKIGKYRRYFEELSDIGRHQNDNRHRLSIDGKIGKKSTKSSIYRRNIGEAPIYRRKIASGLTRRAIGGEFKKNRRKYRRYFGIFTDFSENFPIFPTNPARTQDTKSGSKIVDLGFVKFKSNGTTTKRPLKQIQKSQGAKEKQIFWFSLGVFNGFSRKSNEDEFSRKSNGGWIFLGIKRGLQKK